MLFLWHEYFFGMLLNIMLYTAKEMVKATSRFKVKCELQAKRL